MDHAINAKKKPLTQKLICMTRPMRSKPMHHVRLHASESFTCIAATAWCIQRWDIKPIVTSRTIATVMPPANSQKEAPYREASLLGKGTTRPSK